MKRKNVIPECLSRGSMILGSRLKISGMTVSSNSDESFMRHALKLAEKGRGLTSPNPVVGACVVKGKKIISAAHHPAFGEPHAEALALHQAGRKARGATLYVTLEPCSSWGKTPPCVDVIIRSGIKRVVIAAIDPNPKHEGRAVSALKKAGIQVTTGVLCHEAENQNEGFRKWIKTRLPFVTLKMAQSLDGKIATKMGDSKWISGKKARAFVHSLRAKNDGVAVGKNTLLRDNPQLNVREVKTHWQPWRFVFDAKGDTPTGCRFFRRPGISVVVCAKNNLKRVAKKYQKKGSVILPVEEKNGKLDLKQFLAKIGDFGMTSILVEGGGEIAADFLGQNLVDKVYFVVAPKIIGGRESKTSVEGNGINFMRNAKPISDMTVLRMGEDVILEGYCK